MKPEPDVILLKLPPADPEGPAAGDEFVLIDRSELFPGLIPGEAASREQWLTHFGRLLQQPRMSEQETRTALIRRGLSGEEAEERLATARRRFDVMTSKPLTWERVTRIGYRNADGQEIVRKTDVGGPQGQRIFVLRCTVCGHEYGTYGIDADTRCCPRCQDGPAGLPIPG